MNNPFNRPTEYKPCVEDILYWVAEREAIRIHKLNGIDRKFWTQDPILQKYRFCNVRRRDDRMTQWMIRNMFDHIAHGEDDMWFISAIARYVNWPPSLISLLVNGAIPAHAEEFDPHVFVTVMDNLKAQGLKCWGSAYMLYPGRETGSNKAETVAFRFLLPLANDAAKVREAMAKNRVESVVQELTKFYGWNTFLAGQVAADLTYYPMELGEASDLYEWAPMGPGSQRGLNRLFGYKLNHSWKQGDFNAALRNIRIDISEHVGLEDLTLHDVQNCMCELDKMWRVLSGEGAPRSIYVPERAY